jgi:hypothetical protein
LSERCHHLREEAVNIKSASKHICAQRDLWFRFGEQNLPCELRSNITLTAAGIASTAENAAPYIADGELIVGYNFGDGEYGALSGNRDKDRLILASNGFNGEQIDRYFGRNEISIHIRRLTKILRPNCPHLSPNALYVIQPDAEALPATILFSVMKMY